jgi:hydroxymethylpyrimidine/phosphomethylpyrimidine kinase
MQAQAKQILSLGARAVLIKGGHGEGASSTDFLFDGPQVTRFASKRIATRNTHGSGCTLSAAIAAGLAKGQDLMDATRAAKEYVTKAIAAADRLAVGQGHGPLHHFHATWS